MKALLAIGVCIAAIAWIAVVNRTTAVKEASSPAASHPTSKEATASLTAPNWSHTADQELTDPAEVFRQAFWAHPSKEDVIEHAIRLHWLDAGEVSQWQWYIQVHPSRELIERIITNNSFRLEPSSNIQPPTNPPGWFSPPANSEILSTPGQEMTLYFDAEHNLLVAWAQGKGFTQNVAEPPQKSIQVMDPPPRRLPDERPPIPSS